MKILRIRGANLASLVGEFAIDLEHGVLGRAGLFAITGPTGSGKSTILDAVCLALYAKVPRSSHRTNRNKAPAGSNAELAVDDPRHILRRGAGVGFAEVTFRAIDNATYTARWDVRRSRDRASGKLQHHKLSLVDANGQGLGGATNTSVLAAIANLTGLSFEQFRRAILLAQGDFAAFLQAGVEDRATLLETMTGTEIYGSLSILAHERRKLWEQRIAEVELTLSAAAPMDDETRGALEADKERADVAVTEHETRKARIAETLGWYKELRAREEALAEATRRLADAHAANENAAPRRADLADAERAWNLRIGVRDVRKLEAQATELAEELARSKVRASAQVAAEQEAKTRLSACRRELGGASAAYASAIESALETKRSAAKALMTWLEDNALVRAFTAAGRLDELRKQTADWADLAAAIPRDRSKALVHTETIDAKEAELPELIALAGRSARLADEAEAAESEARRALAAHDPNAIDSRSAELTRKRKTVGLLRGVIGRREVVSKQRAQAGAELRAATTDHDRATAALRDMGPELAAAAARLEEATTTLRRYQSALSASDWRKQLTPGTECMVCGSTKHPWADSAAVESLATDHEGRVRRLEAAHQTLRDAASTLEAEGDSARKRGEAATETERQASEALEALELEWRAPAAALGGAKLEDLDATEWRLDEEEEALAEMKRALRSANEEVLGATKNTATARATATKAGETLVQARAELEQLRATHALVLKDIDAQTARQAALGAALASAFAPLGIDTAWHDAAKATAAMNELAERVDTLRHNEQQFSDLDGSIRDLESVHATATAERVRDVGELDDAALSWVEAPTGLAFGALITWRKQQRAAARSALDEALALEESARTLRRETEVASAVAASAGATHSVTLDRRRAELEAELSEARLDVEDVRRWLDVEDQWRDREREALVTIGNALVSAQAVTESQTDALEAYRATRPEQSHEHALAAGAKIELQLAELRTAASTLSAQLIADDEKRRQRTEGTAALERIRADAQPWLQIAELIGHSSGKTFKSYAQAVTLGILLRGANAYLRQLNPRYELRISKLTELEVEVIDHDLADERRSVHHLSGGETFLTSLALALSLSSLTAGRTQLGSLFIDEGLGTLDVGTLDVALGILENLHDTGRQVGLISHVEGLAERVAARIEVVPLGGGKSRVDVPSDAG